MVIQKGIYIENRYEILEKIGSGGMSDVYKARCHKLNRFVAIKFLKPEYCEDKNFVKNFQIEAQSAAALLNPNVVSVYDVNQAEGIYYIVMEYVDGITLKKYIDRNGKLPVKEATSIAIQIAQGIEAAHNANIIHRDIKPQNVLISREGKIKVTDFGIARTTTANTISTDILGSVQYISPEQARGGQIDNRTDIYSFGIVFFEMVTGQLPFDGDSTVAIALKHIQENVPLAGDVTQGVPSSVSRIIEKCTQRKPDRRYQKMSSLLSDLKTSLISPNEDFVVLEPEPSESATVIMSGDDAEFLRREGTKALELDDRQNVKSAETVRNQRGYQGADRKYDRYSQNSGYDSSYDDHYDYGRDDRSGRQRSSSYPRYSAGSRSNAGSSRNRRPLRKKKADKILVVCGIIAGIVIIGILLVVILKTFNSGGCAGKAVEPETQTETETTANLTVQVPSVIGWEMGRAQTTLEKEGLKVDVKYAHSDSIARGYVIEQSVKSGESMDKGGEIILTVSSGQETVRISDYAGQDPEAVSAALRKIGFTVKTSERYDEEVPEGMVIGTVPAKGNDVALDTEIEIIVSLGPEVRTTIVPELYGYSEGGAYDLLYSNDLYGWSTYEELEGWGGLVIGQYPSAGSEVEEGTWVNIIVAVEPEVPTEGPTEPTTEAPTDPPTEPTTETPVEPTTETPTETDPYEPEVPTPSDDNA